MSSKTWSLLFVSFHTAWKEVTTGTGPVRSHSKRRKPGPATCRLLTAIHGRAGPLTHDLIVFDQEIQYQEHSIKEHGVPEAHVRTLSKAMRRPVVDKVLECPFGDDFQPSGKVESNAVFSSEALQSHVACHMMEIALLTLQKLPSDDDEKVENVDSDHPLEDDERAVAFRN
jgi:hypothetical protein